MAFTTAEESRIKTIEEAINKVLTWLNGMVSKKQLRQLLLLKQEEIESLKTRVTTLETEVQTLQDIISNL